MSSTRTRLWSETAEADLMRIVEYIGRQNNLEAALKVLKKIKQSTSKLDEMPYRGRVVPELKSEGVTHYHELLVQHWRVIYRVSETDVYILSVVDNRQNVEDILLERFIESKL